MIASEPPPNADGADASTKCASQIITSRRKRSWRSIADRRRRCSERRIVPLYHCNSTKPGSRYNNRRCTAYNMTLDNNRCHTQPRMVPQRNRLEKLQQGLRKGSTAILVCYASISLWFSSDVPLSSILISLFIAKPFPRPRVACWFVREGWSLFSKASLYDSICTAWPVAPAGLLLLPEGRVSGTVACAVTAQLKNRRGRSEIR